MQMFEIMYSYLFPSKRKEVRCLPFILSSFNSTGFHETWNELVPQGNVLLILLG
jgi:hypothetical protein